MAQVTIDIPNIGKVTAENAASEDTLIKILAALEKSKLGEKNAKAEDEQRQKNIKSLKDEQKQRDDLSGKNGEAAKKQAEYTKKLQDSTEGLKRMADGFSQAGGAITGFGASLAKTAVSLTAQFASAYDAMANNPIGAAAGLLNTGIDVMAGGAKAASDATAGLAKGLFGAIPFIGGAVSGMVDGLNAASKAAIDLAASVTKTANNIFAAEFDKSVKQLTEYTKVGASFAGGMIEMRTAANDAGVSMTVLGKAAVASSENIRLMGLTQGEGVKLLSGGMKAASTSIGKSGNSLRDEMLALGFSYEEQGQMMAQVAAMDRASGHTRRMTDKELADQTRQYAVDLKVLADITGKDAKKAMEEAQKASMEADIMAQLSPEEADKFKKAYAAMPDYAKKGFLEYVSSGGKAITDVSTNIAMSQNAELGKLIQGTYESIKNPAEDVKNMQKGVLEQTARVSTEQERLAKSGGAVIGMANRLGAGGLDGIAKMQTDMIAQGRQGVEAVGESTTAAEKQAIATDQMTKGYQDVTSATQKAAVEMEKLATSNLGSYAKLLGDTMKETVDVFVKGIKLIKGELKISDLVGNSDKNAVARAKTSEWANQQPGTRTEEGMDFSQLGAAKGGIFNGPETGYLAQLHGNEAVVPMDIMGEGAKKVSELPSPMGSITTSMNSMIEKMTSIAVGSSLTNGPNNSVSDGMQTNGVNGSDISSLLGEFKAATQDQNDKLEAMIRVLQDHRDITQQLSYNLS